MPVTYYTHEEYDAIAAELQDLKQRYQALEKLRPVWAQGHTSDSMAAQSATNAMTQLWKILGAAHQTQAVQIARGLIRDALQKDKP